MNKAALRMTVDSISATELESTSGLCKVSHFRNCCLALTYRLVSVLHFVIVIVSFKL